uniref:Uncharacterized protein n=1 Tax=Rhizophora mucronata TaxID=61149 RepID=A0A2P2J116_RHIMU
MDQHIAIRIQYILHPHETWNTILKTNIHLKLEQRKKFLPKNPV